MRGLRGDGDQRVLELLAGLEAWSKQKAGDGSTGSHYEKASIALDRLLQDRGWRLDQFDRAERAILLEAIAGVVTHLEERARAMPIQRSRLDFLGSVFVNFAERDYERILERWESQKNKLEAKAKLSRHELGRLLIEARHHKRKHQALGFRQPLSQFPPYLYYPFMAFLGVLEFPANLTAFRILGEAEYLTWLMTLGPSISIPFLAHFLGTKWRQWPSKTDRSWQVVLVAGFCSVSLVIGLASIAVLRAAYVKQQMGGEPLLPALGLLGLNFVLLIAGTLAAYFSHDPDRELERVCKVRKRISKRVEKAKRSWEHLIQRHDTGLARTIQDINVVRPEAAKQILDYQEAARKSSTDVILPEHFQIQDFDQFFEVRVIGGELERIKESTDDVIQVINQEFEEALHAEAHALA